MPVIVAREDVPAYLRGLASAAEHSLNCLAYDSAARLLDLGLSYAFPDGLPKEALPLWDVKLSLETALSTTDRPEGWNDPHKVWEDSMEKADKILKEFTCP